MNALFELLNLPESEKIVRGLVHTPAEIAQQPETWQSTFRLFQTRRAEILAFLDAAGLGAGQTARPAVLLVGAGTSDYIGQSLAMLFREMWKCEVAVVASTDLLTHMDQLCAAERKYVWISFSRSGDTPEGVAVLERAWERRPDIHHIVVSCNAEGRMTLASVGNPKVLAICLDDPVNDRGLAMTSSFSNMVVFGHCLAHAHDLERYEPILDQLIDGGKSFLPIAAECASDLAKGPYGKACFVGAGPLRAVAKESSLKLLELTAGRVLTLSESALGLRHGPMAALDHETLFVCFQSSDPRVRVYERSLLDEIRSKRLVTMRVAVAGSTVSATDSVAEYNLAPAVRVAVEDNYRPVVDVIFGQILGLFFSLRCNLQPDFPSPNGAISRVVQNISIDS